jgi:hypothetical protein
MFMRGYISEEIVQQEKVKKIAKKVTCSKATGRRAARKE